MLRHVSTLVAILSTTMGIMKLMSNRYALRQADREARAATRLQHEEAQRSTTVLEARLPAFHHPTVETPGTGQPPDSPLNPQSPPEGVLPFDGLHQQSPGVYLYRNPLEEEEMDSVHPCYTAAEDEMGTLGEKFWESEEEETPPASPKAVAVPKPLVVSSDSRCAICERKFNVFKNR